MSRIGLVLGAAPLAAAAVLLSVPSASAATGTRAEPSPASLDGERVVLDATPAPACDPQATTHAVRLTGTASGPYPGRYDATATTTVAGSQRTTVITFSIGAQVTGTQTRTAATTASGPCVALAGTERYHALIGTSPDRGTATLTAAPASGGSAVLLFAGDPTPGPSGGPSPTPEPTPTDPGPTTQPTQPTHEPTPDASPDASPDPGGTPTTTNTPASPSASADPSASVEPGTTTPLSFSYAVRPDTRPGRGGAYRGGCEVTGGSASAPVQIVCTDVTGYRAKGHHVRFTGHAQINETPTSYRIDVTDGSPDGRPDVFRIATSSGFVGGGELTGGNLTIG